MRIEERDERLGAELDRAARSIKPSDRFPDVVRRGSRRRAVRWGAIGAALAVFVVGVTWAGLQLRGNNEALIPERGPEWPVYEGSGGDWKLSVPPEWHVTPIANDCRFAGYQGGVIVSSVAFDFHHPEGGVDGCDGRFVLDGFPKTGVALALQPIGTYQVGFTPEPNTAFPLRLSNLIPTGGIRGGPASAYLVITVDRSPAYRLSTWVGRGASLKDHDVLLRVVESIDFAGAPRWVTYRDPSQGFSLQYPSNWFRVAPAANSVPAGYPADNALIIVASYRPAVDGPNCGPFPSGISHLRFVNALIKVTEIPHAVDLPRPDAFGPRSATSAVRRKICSGDDLPFRWWTFEFTEAGRSFRIEVASGVGDAGEVRNVVWRILNGLRFDPR